MKTPQRWPVALVAMGVMWVGGVSAGSLQCDQAGSWAPQTVSLDDGQVVQLKGSQRYCTGQTASGQNQSGSLKGLSTAGGEVLVPADYNAIIPLNTGLSLVQKDNLNGVPDADDGWYLYRHGRGPEAKLPWTRFEVLQPQSLPPLPGVVIVVGDDGQAKGEAVRALGFITSYMNEVKTLPETLGHPVLRNIEYFARLRGERHALELLRNNALVAHTPMGSQIYNLQGEAVTPLLADLQIFGRGRDAATTLMKTRHRDLPAPGQGILVEGQSDNTVYMPLDHQGQVMPLPEGAVGVMWIPAVSERSELYIAGWALVFPKGHAVELAIGTGDLPSVVARAESLPRYAGMKFSSDKSTAHRLALKLPDVAEWMAVSSATLRVDERSYRAAQPGTLWAQARKDVTDRQLAERQRAAERQAELQRYREEEAQRLRAAGARAEAELQRLRTLAQAGQCDHAVRAALGRLGAEAAKNYLSKCGMHSAEDFALAAQAGVDQRSIASARSELLRRNAPLEAQRARNAGMAALANAMKFRNEDNTWADVRVYDRNGNFQGQRIMTRNQAETLGARP